MQVSSNGGTHPQWRGDGRELYYRNGRNLMAVDFSPAAAGTAGTPKLLFKTGPIVNSWRSYIPSKDGKRFLMNLHLSDPDLANATVVINWDHDVRAGK